MNAKVTRIVLTAVALVATTGSVLLMRSGARALADWMQAGEEMTALPRPRTLVPMPKVHDLGRVASEGDAIVIGGQPVGLSEERLPMPLDVAQAVLRDRAVAKGWRPLGGELWLKGDGHGLVYQSVSAADVATSVAATYEFPQWNVPVGAGADTAQAFREIVMRGASRTRALLPSVLASVIVGDVVYLQKFARVGGTSLHLTSVVPYGAREAREAFLREARTGGWTVSPEAGYATKDNLSLFVSFTDFSLGGTQVSYRVADDELRETSGRTMERVLTDNT